jgi:cyclophilin family peptidyl-prolyl cis-trans isomerase
MALIIVVIGCSQTSKKEKIVVIETEYGNIELQLYDQTPLHRDNFIKLANSGFYDSLTFHRVIKNFVIQGGDPFTKGFVPDSLVGEEDSGYLIDAEFNDTLFHKRGALGMAREGDDINPKKKSSGSQFYIVVGKVFNDTDIFLLEEKINKRIRTKLLTEIKAIKTAEYSLKTNHIDTIKLNIAVNTELDSILKVVKEFKVTEKQKAIYKSIGGIPHLDGNYTVFGDVIKGMDVVEKISLTKTNERDIPVTPIRMKIKVK